MLIASLIPSMVRGLFARRSSSSPRQTHVSWWFLFVYVLNHSFNSLRIYKKKHNSISISVLLQLTQTHPLQINFGYIHSPLCRVFDVFFSVAPCCYREQIQNFSVWPNANAAKYNATHELIQFDKQLNIFDTITSVFFFFWNSYSVKWRLTWIETDSSVCLCEC